MKKSILIFAGSLLLSGCGVKKEKPFIIVNKQFLEGKNTCYFEYQDPHGTYTMFEDVCGKYNIGDTIK